MASWFENQTPEQLRSYLLTHPTGSASFQEKDSVSSSAEPFSVWSHYVKLVEQRYQSDPESICESYEWLLLGVPINSVTVVAKSSTGTQRDQVDAQKGIQEYTDIDPSQQESIQGHLIHTIYGATRLKGTGYPLLYGYWIKWAHQAKYLSSNSLNKVIEIFELAVVYNSSCLELWISYIIFLMDNLDQSSQQDAKILRDTLEKAVNNAGHLFHSGFLWEKFIEFEQLQNEMIRVTNIYRRVFENAIDPVQMDDIWKKFESHLKDISVTELTSNVEERGVLQELRTDEEKKEAILSWSRANFDRSKIISLRIKEFEDRIKRNYFHPKPLDEDDLDNWRRYLEYRELISDHEATKQLYSQAIVACAHSLDIYKRYTSYLVGREEFEEARILLERAILSYCPGSRPSIWLFLAEFEEQYGHFPQAVLIYEALLSSLRVTPKSSSKSISKDEKIGTFLYSIGDGHLETGVQYLQALFRNSEDDSLEQIYERYKCTFASSGGHFGSVYAKLVLHLKGSEEASKIYTSNMQLHPNCKFSWVGLIEFEIDRRIRQVEAKPATEQVDYICSLFDHCIQNTQMVYSDREYLYKRFVSFARQYSTISKVRDIEKLWFPFQSDFNVTKRQIQQMKRLRSQETDDRPFKRQRENGT